VDHRADIYSLGVVFYEMLTGELPLGKFQPPSKKVQVDVRLDEVVLHALEKEPERRYQQVSQVKTAVETIVHSPQLEVRSPKSKLQSPKSEPGAGLARTAPVVPLPRGLAVARWMARILGTLLLAFYGLFILGEGLPPIATQPEGVQLSFTALGLMLLGFVVGWKREGAAALLICSGWTLWQISEGRITRTLFQTPLPVGLLYGYCWWGMHGRKSRAVGVATAALALALGLGMLFLPTSVRINGVVGDALTSQPVVNAELTLQPAPRQTRNSASIPNARSDKNGRFSLYVGWYAVGKKVSILAPGYQGLEASLGPRPLGRRQLTRDFQLQPTDFNAKIIQLSKPGTLVEEAIRLLGEPEAYCWGEQTFSRTNLPATYILRYPQGVEVMVSDGLVNELRSELPGPGFTWRGQLRLGSSLDEVLQALGPPSRTVVGQALDFAPDVLYKDIGGKPGRCYYSRPDQHIRLFFRGYRVCALYLPLTDEMSSNYKQPGPL
jgi:hypothetical protein